MADAGPNKAELKKWLKKADSRPIHMAFAFDKEGKAVVKLDGMKQGRALEKGLKEAEPDSKNHRFGTVVVDPDEPDTAKFIVNKAVGGAARKLSIALKGTGFRKVQILLEDGSALDSAESDEEPAAEDGAEAGVAAADDDEAAAAGAKATPTDPDAGQAYASDAARPDDADMTAKDAQAGQLDPAALTATLTVLVKRMLPLIQTDPDRKDELRALAAAAQASLKAGDLDAADTTTNLLLAAIDKAAAAAGGDGSPTGADAADATAAPADASRPDTPDPSAAAAARPAADPAALTAALTALVKQALPVLAADPAQRDALKGIMMQAQAALKAGDLGTAGGHVDALRDLLNGAGGQPAAGSGAAPSADGQTAPAATPDPAAAAAPAIAKAKQAWVATRQKVENDIGSLHGAFSSAFKGHDLEADLTKAFRTRVDTVLGTLDEKLSQTLELVNGASDHSERSKLVQEAHSMIDSFTKHVASDPTIAALDSNPFVPLSIQKTMTATLAALSKSIR